MAVRGLRCDKHMTGLLSFALGYFPVRWLYSFFLREWSRPGFGVRVAEPKLPVPTSMRMV